MADVETSTAIASQNSSEWRQNWLLGKLDLFAALLKLRLRKSPYELWTIAFKTDTKNDNQDSHSIDVNLFDNIEFEKLALRCESIFVWLKDELGELSDNIASSEGFVRIEVISDSPDGVPAPSTKRIMSKCDPSTFESDQSLVTLFERLFAILSAMLIFAQYDAFKELCASKWAENLRITLEVSKLISDKEKSTILAQKVESLGENLEIDRRNENFGYKFEKFKSDDELYVLRHGLPGYKEALDKVLSSIGGHEWNTKVLDVLEQRANMIDNFEQLKLLVDVLHSASIMIDMRIQSSLYGIFKAAFHNQSTDED